ncbi:10561_t:CDS:2 [Paraglomus brasilianum]|uniref:10561_t:CDS:1 n=1 Tax=Paraglomus brasilianum TaxID=144538 RepID=A0A9N9ATE0_9GLOM|nr:10561_t:CDS:2 [Paraglomus brasilianum]
MERDSSDKKKDIVEEAPPPYTPVASAASSTSPVPRETDRLNASTPKMSYTNPYPAIPNPTYGTSRDTVILTPAVPLADIKDQPVVTTCPQCQRVVLSHTRYRNGSATWLASFALMCFGLNGGCCLIPFCLNDLKNVIHECPNCGRIMAEYSRLNGHVNVYRRN